MTGSRGTASRCPCGSGAPYAVCCKPFHVRAGDPASAELLMRARYSAFVKRNDAYLLYSWHPDTRPTELALDRRTLWTGLRILDATEGSASDAVGTVEFIATYELDGSVGELHESSRFGRVGGRWVYVGEVP